MEVSYEGPYVAPRGIFRAGSAGLAPIFRGGTDLIQCRGGFVLDILHERADGSQR